jgi:hypothetical protein
LVHKSTDRVEALMFGCTSDPLSVKSCPEIQRLKARGVRRPFGAP